MDEEKAINIGLLELFSTEQDKYNKKVFTRVKKIESLEDIGKIEDKNNDNDNSHDNSKHRKCCPKHIPKLEKSCRDPCHAASKLIIDRIENGEDTNKQNSDDQKHQNQKVEKYYKKEDCVSLW